VEHHFDSAREYLEEWKKSVDGPVGGVVADETEVGEVEHKHQTGTDGAVGDGEPIGKQKDKVGVGAVGWCKGSKHQNGATSIHSMTSFQLSP
jgi:hypothetical protein